MKTTAIVLAGGSGSRMKTKTKKQYLLVEGKPVLWYSLHTFEESPLIDAVILVCGAGEEAACREQFVEKFGFRKVEAIVAGGKERYHSVHAGLLAAHGCDLVLIHDGARPFVDGMMLQRVMDCLATHPACVVGMPVKDTIKIVDDNCYAVSTPPRSSMWQIQTPQCFITKEIKEAYRKMMEAKDDSVTDDGMVMETYGIRGVRMIKGSYENIKITTPEDMLLGEAILKGRRQSQ